MRPIIAIAIVAGVATALSGCARSTVKTQHFYIAPGQSPQKVDFEDSRYAETRADCERRTWGRGVEVNGEEYDDRGEAATATALQILRSPDNSLAALTKTGEAFTEADKPYTRCVRRAGYFTDTSG